VPWLWATLGVAAAGAVVWLVGWSSLLTLRTVEVHGVEADTATEVEQAIDAPMGVPLARLDLAALDRSAEQVDAVRAVEVTRVWPRSLRIDVQPRVPAAAVRLGDRWRYVDDTGTVFGRLASQPTGLTVVDVSADSATEEQTVAAMTVLRALPDAVRDRLGTLRVASAADVQLVLDDGATVVWGTAERSARKAQVLEALLKVGARGYDVSAPDRPALRGVPAEPDEGDDASASE
jgi:cell division protein FtsQ